MGASNSFIKFLNLFILLMIFHYEHESIYINYLILLKIISFYNNIYYKLVEYIYAYFKHIYILW